MTVMVTLTGSLSSPGGGGWPVAGETPRGDWALGEEALGEDMTGSGGKPNHNYKHSMNPMVSIQEYISHSF